MKRVANPQRATHPPLWRGASLILGSLLLGCVVAFAYAWPHTTEDLIWGAAATAVLLLLGLWGLLSRRQHRT